MQRKAAQLAYRFFREVSGLIGDRVGDQGYWAAPTKLAEIELCIHTQTIYIFIYTAFFF